MLWYIFEPDIETDILFFYTYFLYNVLNLKQFISLSAISIAAAHLFSVATGPLIEAINKNIN